MPKLVKLAESLDWPKDPLETVTIECAGKGFFEYQTLVAAGDEVTFLDETDDDDDTDEANDDQEELQEDSSPEIDLFALSESELEDVNFYQVLHLPYRPQLTADDVKKAYRKACLKYHPDKSGRGEEDEVFLKVKTAFETLSTQKQAYDSTEMPFDDGLPAESPKDFFAEYGAAFERNLHFDARLLPVKKKNTGRRKSRNHKHSKTPAFGDASQPIQEVHEFYDYWTHFETWRDFSLEAARELETQDHLDQAESRFEKRWYQNQIDKRAKKLKQQEQSRITTLVERAMACDPRLIQERKRLMEEKGQRQREREQGVLDKKRQEQEAKLAEERRMEEEKVFKNQEKLQRDKEKKLLRKTKQVFKKFVSEALASLQKNEHELEDDIDLVCSELDREQLIILNANLESKSSPSEVLELVTRRASSIHIDKQQQEEQAAAEASTAKTNGNAIKEPRSNAKIPFTKEEMSTFAKGVKKFPPGGSNRWDQIANYINNVCRPDTPRTKEECIEVNHQNGKPKPVEKNGVATKAPSSVSAPAATSSGDDEWTEEQDKQLQDGLAQYPTNMDKNERWTSIAKAVRGKSKKHCVNRFKAIRDTIKHKN
jgi:DnaJ family protein C protein 2